MICSNRLPYKGNGQAIGDLIGGHVSMMVLSLSTILGSVNAGQLIALAVTTSGSTSSGIGAWDRGV
jgi:tripartite-type tricarboxylate transporter receptor subunit TctC